MVTGAQVATDLAAVSKALPHLNAEQAIFNFVIREGFYNSGHNITLQGCPTGSLIRTFTPFNPIPGAVRRPTTAKLTGAARSVGTGEVFQFQRLPG